MTATILRYILFGLIILLLAGSVTGAWWVNNLLAAKVTQTDHATIDAEVGLAELQQLKTLEKQLASQQDIIERAKQIAASSDQYRYQDQVISDIADYATQRGIQINTFDFTVRKTASAATEGAKKTAFTVTLRGPLDYITLIRFIQDIEKNLTKIQVTSMTLTPAKDPTQITDPTIGLEVYLKT